MSVNTAYETLDQMKLVSMGVLGFETLGKKNLRCPELEIFLKRFGEIETYKVPSDSPVKASVLNESVKRINECVQKKDNVGAKNECESLCYNLDKIYLHLVTKTGKDQSPQS